MADTSAKADEDAPQPMETEDETKLDNNAQDMVLQELMSVLKPVAARWYQIGLVLKLESSQLHTVESDLRASPTNVDSEKHLKEMLRLVVENGKPSWKQIAQALSHVNEAGLAEQVMKDHGVVMDGAAGNNVADSEMATEDEKSDEPLNRVPDYKTQKTEIHAALQQRLKQGDTWYLVDVKWMKQWKKYTGYDQWDQTYAGEETANPGPLDNSSLFRDTTSDSVKDHLMEELDYFLLPESAWTKLTSWYGISQNSRTLARKVVEHGMYMKHCKVEVYLLEFKLSLQSNLSSHKTRSFSRADTVGDLEAALKEEFGIEAAAECRVWHRFMTHTYELLSNSSQTLQDAGLYNGQTIVLEKKNQDGSWPRQTQVTGSSQHPTRSTDTFTASNNNSASRSSSGGGASGYTSASGYYWGSHNQPTQPGLCGLSNLGNTCFMNSALQCLSNTVPLTEYFTGTQAGYKPYKKHINRANPLGMGGAIAEAYGALLDDVWSGKTSCVAPRHFKTQVGRYAPQFVGYAQHDSQELLAFLLDGLHEDLNLVREKPYVDMTVKTDNRLEKEIAEETWMKYLLRNQSVIVREFQGQLKSTLVCPKCKGISKIFDPFMFLSLPLPIKKTRAIYVTVVRSEATADFVKYKLKVPKRGYISDLKKELSLVCGIPGDQLTVVDVYNSRFHRIYTNKESLSHILDRDDIFAYQLCSDSNPEAFIHVPVYMRESVKRQVSYSYQSYSQKYYQLFGIPMVVKLPRQCSYRQLYKAIYQQYGRALSPWTQTKELAEDKETDAESENKEPMEEDKGGNHDNNNKEDGSEHEGEGNVKRETEEADEKEKTRSDSTEDEEGNKPEEEKNEKEVAKEEREPDLFTLSAVNAYGSQEVRKIEDEPDKVYTVSNQTYIGCNWEAEVKEACYKTEVAEKIVEHESCHEDATNQKKNIHLQDCIQLFTDEETLSVDDAWYCPECKDFVQASKKFDLWKVPEILVIHLKRFSYDRYWRDKLDVLVDFPVNGLDLTKYVCCPGEPQPIYDLYAISNHFGGMGGGHYTAFAKNHRTGKWYNFDDSHVSETSEERLVSASAYVLFYRRRSEGRPVRRNILDRTLSQSFADEHKKLKEKYATLEEEEEEGERGREAEKGAEELKEKLEEPENMEAETNQEVNNNINRSRNESSTSEDVFESTTCSTSLEEPD